MPAATLGVRKKILLLGGKQQETAVAEILTSLTDYLGEALDDRYEVCHSFFNALEYSVSGQEIQITDLKNKAPLESYALIFFRGKILPYAHHAQTVSSYAQQHGILCINQEFLEANPAGKLGMTVMLAQMGLPAPATLFAAPQYMRRSAAETLGFPMVVKADMGARGQHNHLIRTQTELDELLKKESEVDYIAQEFIENDCDYRFLMIGSEALIIRRSRTGDTHLNNISEGARADLVPAEEFPQRILEDCRRIMQKLDLQIAGIDLLYNPQTDREYYLEVNRLPQLNTSAFAAEKAVLLRRFITQLLGRPKG